jgi:hypothetical protein
MEQQQRVYITGLTAEEKEERRKLQLRESQLRYREKHGLITVKPTEEERIQRRKDKARERYLKKRAEYAKACRPAETPLTYNVEYQRAYHRQYYEKNKEKLLGRSKTRYLQRTTQEAPLTEI